MIKKRLIAVIILRNGRVVQSEKFIHNHVIHYDAFHAVECFSRWDVDEIILLNVSKENKSKDEFLKIVAHVSKTCWVPLSVGGHIDEVQYGMDLISNGADKIVLNSQFYYEPNVPHELYKNLGRQCIIASIDLKNFNDKKLVYVDRGNHCTNNTIEDWVTHCTKYGAGEFFLNNIDHDGNRQGYDLDSLRKCLAVTQAPVIIFGGAFLEKHFADGIECGASAVAAANIFHYKEMATKRIKRYLNKKKYNIRIQK